MPVGHGEKSGFTFYAVESYFRSKKAIFRSYSIIKNLKKTGIFWKAGISVYRLGTPQHIVAQCTGTIPINAHCVNCSRHLVFLFGIAPDKEIFTVKYAFNLETLDIYWDINFTKNIHFQSLEVVATATHNFKFKLIRPRKNNCWFPIADRSLPMFATH